MVFEAHEGFAESRVAVRYDFERVVLRFPVWSKLAERATARYPQGDLQQWGATPASPRPVERSHMANTGSCIDCGTETPAVRCPPCQRRNNDRLQAEHELTVRAMFRAAEGHPLGHSVDESRKSRPRRRTSEAAAAD